jgi:hypothetical protein
MVTGNTRTPIVCLFTRYYLTTDPNMSQWLPSDPPTYSIQDFSQPTGVNVTVLLEKDDNPTVNIGNLSHPLRFDAVAERLTQLGKCA